MSTKKWILLSALAGVAAVAVLSLSKPPQPADQGAPSGTAPGIISSKVPTPVAADGGTPAPAPQGSPFAASAPQQDSRALLDSIAPPACRTGEKGELVIDQQTREDVDMMTTVFKPEQALAKLLDACKDAPAGAQRQMRDLHQQYVQYSQAVVQTFPIEEQGNIPIDKLEGVLLKGLHDLRVQYFGAERACAMFCEEEAMTKRMLGIAIEYKQRKPNVSTEEAVGYAQGEVLKEIEAKKAKQ